MEWSKQDYSKLTKPQQQHVDGYKQSLSKLSETFSSQKVFGNLFKGIIPSVTDALASGMIAAVISEENEPSVNPQVIPDHNVLMIPIQERDEAYYLAGLLNSAIVSEFVKAYIAWFYSSHILEHINIPAFDRENKLHSDMSKASFTAHHEFPTNDDQALMDALAIEILNEALGTRSVLS